MSVKTPINFKWIIEKDWDNYYFVRCGDFAQGIITDDLSRYLVEKTKELESRYIVADSDIVGYKMMYQRFTSHDCYEDADKFSEMELYIPILVEVKIPKRSLIYVDPDTGKHRASEGIITKIYSVKTMLDMTDKFSLGANVIAAAHSFFTVFLIKFTKDNPSECMCRNLSYHTGMDGCFVISPIKENELFSMYEIDSKNQYKRMVCAYYPRGDARAYLSNSPKYEVGKLIRIENFDTQPNACSTGFHFFRSPKEAIFYAYSY